MSETILVGHHDRVTKVSSTQWEKHLTDARPRIGARLNFMSPDHHRVRNFVVTELPRNHGRPLKPAQIARSLRLSLAQVEELLGEMEKKLFFLVRNSGGEVSWAFPVTSEKTPHRLTFSSGERTFAA